MALPISNIETGNWNRYDRKTIVALISGTMDGNPQCRFALYSRPDLRDLLLEKSGDDVVTNSEAMTVSVQIGGDTEEQLSADYELIEGGVYWWEIYDNGTPLKIANGYATIGPGKLPA